MEFAQERRDTGGACVFGNASARMPCSRSREHCTHNRLQAGFLTRALPRDSFPSRIDCWFLHRLDREVGSGQWTAALGFPAGLPEQALTAARPSRIFTACPFGHSGAKRAPEPAAVLFFFERAPDSTAPAAGVQGNFSTSPEKESPQGPTPAGSTLHWLKGESAD